MKDDVLQECTCNCQFHCILCFVDLVGRGVGRSIPDPMNIDSVGQAKLVVM